MAAADIFRDGALTNGTNGKQNINTITAAFKQQFADSYQLALQKTESVLTPLITNAGTIQGSSWTFQDMGVVEMNKRSYGDRFSATKFDMPEVGTRMAILEDYDLYIPVEPTDIHRLTAQVDGPYMQLMVAAANRQKDRIIQDALLGNVQRKQDNTLDSYGPSPVVGWTNQAFDTTNQQLFSGTSAAKGGKPLTKEALIKMRALFRRNRADKETIYMLYNAAMMQAILGDSTLTSSDFMAVQMLQTGDVASNWLGFQWVPYEELNQVKEDGTISSTASENICTQAIAFNKSALQFGTGQNYTTDVGTRHDLRLVKQLSAQMSFGAGRTNEKKVATLISLN